MTCSELPPPLRSAVPAFSSATTPALCAHAARARAAARARTADGRPRAGQRGDQFLDRLVAWRGGSALRKELAVIAVRAQGSLAAPARIIDIGRETR